MDWGWRVSMSFIEFAKLSMDRGQGNMHRLRIILTVFGVLGSVLTASADGESTYSRWHRGGDDGQVPAAPEPAQVLLIAGGLALTGVYIAWRRRKQRVQMPT